MSEDDLLIAIENAGLSYLDMRPKGGALWVIGGREIQSKVRKLQADTGAYFTFSKKGSRSTRHRSAWFTHHGGDEAYRYREASSHKEQPAKKPKPASALKPAAKLKSAPQAQTPRRAPQQHAPQANPTKPTCGTCANCGMPACTNGGFAVCDSWQAKEDAPDYWPEMRRGGREGGFGGRLREIEDEEYVQPLKDRDKPIGPVETPRDRARKNKKRRQ